MQDYFKFKGIKSTDMGVIVKKYPQKIIPNKRYNLIEIGGRNGVLHEDLETYANYTLSMECALKDIANLNKVCAWLNGSGEVIFGDEPDKKYKVWIVNQIPFQEVLRRFPTFLIQFDCFPFKYSVNNFGDNFTLTAPSFVHNDGTVYAQPTITIYGTGDITLTINGTDYGLTGVDGSVTIDSEMMEVYKGTTNANNKYSALDFPRFEVGQNTISWTGSVTKVEIEPKWRWL